MLKKAFAAAAAIGIAAGLPILAGTDGITKATASARESTTSVSGRR